MRVVAGDVAMQLFAVCAPGLDPVLLAELHGLGYRGPAAGELHGHVSCPDAHRVASCSGGV